jgi:hypothetical protein
MPAQGPRLRPSPALADVPSTARADALRVSIQGRYSHLQAQGRVAEALYGVAIDLLGPALEDLSTSERGRLLQALDAPVGAAAHDALEALQGELAAFLGREMPAALPALDVHGLVSIGRVSRLDFE